MFYFIHSSFMMRKMSYEIKNVLYNKSVVYKTLEENSFHVIAPGKIPQENIYFHNFSQKYLFLIFTKLLLCLNLSISLRK